MMNVARRIGRGFGPMVLLLVVALSTGGTSGCSSDSGGATEPELPPPPPPPPPPPLACVTNNTATLISRNDSQSARNYVVVLNGSIIGTIVPGDSTISTVAAQIAHTLEFNLDNMGTPACSQANPILAQCATNTFFCTF